MKILFVENRSTTWLWSEVAERLSYSGHEIYWVVQNRLFTPSVGMSYILPLPDNNCVGTSSVGDLYDDIRMGDRGFLHFGLKGNHYHHYDIQIGAVFDNVKPDVVFGEVTQFQELLAIRHAKDLDIPYYSPSGTRYPVDRMCFFAYGTLDQVGGCGVELTNTAAELMLNDIMERKTIPSYMLKTPSMDWKSMLLSAYSRGMLLASWLLGERFITPSPMRKISLEWTRSICFKRWERISVRELPKDLDAGAWVLYPLQMQPESNIDVWGRPWNDQCKIIENAALALAKIGGYLVVKPNPKSKYELSDALCNLRDKHTNIIFMSHTVEMGWLFKLAPLVMTVTGTVLLECIFSGKPIACLGEHAMSRYPSVIQLQKPEQIAEVLQKVSQGKILGATHSDAIFLLKFLYRTSYPAQLWDPITRPSLTNQHEINRLTSAFVDILSIIKRGGAAMSWSNSEPIIEEDKQ
jgi:hypothetical protein